MQPSTYHYPCLHLLCGKFQLFKLLLVFELVKLGLVDVHDGMNHIGIVCGGQFLQQNQSCDYCIGTS